jgi:hypothetical protein
MAVVALPGRRAGLEGRVEKVVTSDRRIDRRLLPDRPPSGRLVSGPRGRPVSAAISGPDGASGRLPHAGHQRGHGWSLRQHRGHSNWCGARPGRGPEPLLPKATAASKRGGHGRCPVSITTPTAHAGTGADSPQTLPDTAAVAVRHAVQVPDTPRRTVGSGVCPAAAVATATGRRVGGRWWDAASAGGCGRAGRSGGRGAGRGHRSSPAG